MHNGTRSETLAPPADGVDRWATWMAQVQDGDSAAYRRLLTDLLPYLSRLVARRVRDRDEVEDVVQDILLTLHRIRATYDRNRPFKPWLVSIVRRRIADRLRRQARIGANEISFDSGDETIAEPLANPSQEEWSLHQVQSAVERLSNSQRQAFEAVRLRELSLKEAAAETGLSIGALKVAVHRAMRALRLSLLADSERK